MTLHKLHVLLALGATIVTVGGIAIDSLNRGGWQEAKWTAAVALVAMVGFAFVLAISVRRN
jgi:hypothetical protein